MSETVALTAATALLSHPQVSNTTYGTQFLNWCSLGKQKKLDNPTVWWTRVAEIVVATTFLVNVWAIYLTDAVPSIISGTFAVVVSLHVLRNHYELNAGSTFRQMHNKMRDKVNAFKELNAQLRWKFNSFHAQAAKLKEVEQTFYERATLEGADFNTLQGLIKENRAITDQITDLIKLDATQELMRVLLEAPPLSEEHSYVSEAEINRMLQRMREIPGIRVNEGLLRKKIGVQRSLGSIRDLLEDIDKNLGPDKCIFYIDEEDNANSMRGL